MGNSPKMVVKPRVELENTLASSQNPAVIDGQELWADAFNNCAHGIWISIPSTSTIFSCNAVFANRQGRTIEEISGIPILSMYAPADHQLVTRGLLEADRTGRTHFDAHMQREDGSIYPVKINVVSVRHEAKELLYRVVTQEDMTDYQLDEAKLLRLNHLFAALSQINQSIVRIHDRDTLFKELCQVAITNGKFRMAWIGLIDQARKFVKPVVFAGAENGYLERIKITVDNNLLSLGPTGKAILENRVFICQNISVDPIMLPWREAALEHGYHSSAAVPFCLHNQVIGAFTVYAAAPFDFDVDEEILLNDIGRSISFALETMDAEKDHLIVEQQIRLKSEDLILINALNDAVNYGEDIEGITEVFIRESRKTYKCKDAAIYLFNSNKKYLEMQSNTITISPELTKNIEKVIGRSIPRVQIPFREDGFFKKFLADRSGFITNNPQEIQQWIMEFTYTPSLSPFLRALIQKSVPQIYKLLHIRSIMLIPLISLEKTIGYLDLSSEEDFTAEDLVRVQNVSRQMTAVIQRKQAEERVQKQLKRINALNEIVRAINASLDLKLSLNILVKKVCSQLNADAAAIFLLNAYNQSLELISEDGFKLNIRRTKVDHLGHGLAGSVGQVRKVLHIPNLAEVKEQYNCEDLIEREEFVEFIGIPLISKGKLKGVLEIFNRSMIDPDADWMDYMETLGNQAAIAIDNAQLFEDIQHSNLELITAYDATITGWSKAMDLRDKEAEGHTQRVTELAMRMAEKLGISREEQIHIRRGALLHDIGKLGISDAILFNPAPLSAEELMILHQHPLFAWRMLSNIDYLRSALDIPYCHHEKWDGTGYPRGLKGEEIPLAARLFTVGEVWDILLHDRPYRAAWDKEKVIEYLREQAGIQFDPKLVDIFLKEFVN